MALRGAQSQANIVSATTCAVTVTPIGIALGDIILFYGSGAGSGTATFTFPTGGATWARPPGLTKTNNGSTGGTFDVAYAVATAVEVAASTLTFTSNQNDFQTGHIRAYSGRNTSAPFSFVNQAVNTTAASPPIPFSVPGGTAAAADDIALVFGLPSTAATDTITISTLPAGFGNMGGVHGNTAAFSQSIAFCDFVNNPGGSLGPFTGNINATSGATFGYGGFVISLAAAGGGGTPFMGQICMLEKEQQQREADFLSDRRRLEQKFLREQRTWRR